MQQPGIPVQQLWWWWQQQLTVPAVPLTHQYHAYRNHGAIVSNIATYHAKHAGQHRQPDRFSTQLSPLFLFRLAGLPLDAIGAIGSARLCALADAMDRHEATLLAVSAPLDTVLHQVINQVAKDDALRADVRELIELKRAVHNGRAPKRLSALAVASSYLDRTQQATLATWADAACGLRTCVADCDAALVLDLEQSRLAIHAWANRPIFKRALQIANAQLEEKLDRYFARPDQPVTHKLRLLDNSLYGYFLRASSKTSPFSTFGVVSYGMWSDLHPGQPAHLARDIGYTTKTRLNAALLARMASSISKARIANADVDLRLNPTCIVTGERVHFLRMRSRPLSRLTAFGSLNSHGMFSITVDAQLRHVLALLHGGAALPFQQLQEQLGRRVQAGQHHTHQQLRPWLGYLLDVGLLESTDACDGASYDMLLAHVRHGASRVGASVLSDFVASAEHITAQMDTDDVALRRTLLGGIAAAVSDLSAGAGGLQIKLEDSTIFYEDATLACGRYGLPYAGNADFVDQLKQLQQLQPVFDTGAPLRAALVEYFKKRHGLGGACHDVPRFAEEFARECAGPFQNVSSQAKSTELFDASFDVGHSENLRASRVLHCLRNLCMRTLRHLGRDSAAEEVRITPAQLDTLRAQMPTRLHPSYSGSFFIQPCTPDPSPSGWVLNKLYGGSGQLMSRLLYLWEDERDDLATRTLRQYIADNVPPGSVIAELPGNGDSNLNFHPRLVDHVIGGANGNIALSDLTIRHDAASDTLKLVSNRIGQQILPVYLGGLVSALLPDVQKLLLLFGVSTRVALPGWDSLFAGRPATGVQRYPRISVGHIVVLRRMWAIAPQLVPRRAAGETDAALYLRLRAWYRDHDLPARSYITFARSDAMQETNQRKPMFFDFTSIRAVLALQKELEKHDGVLWLAEALPDPVRDTGATAPSRHHCEYIFDLTTTVKAPS